MAPKMEVLTTQAASQADLGPEGAAITLAIG